MSDQQAKWLRRLSSATPNKIISKALQAGAATIEHLVAQSVNSDAELQAMELQLKQAIKERDELAAKVAAAQMIADADKVTYPMHTMRDGEPFEYESSGWSSSMGRDLHRALKSDGEYLDRRDARVKAEALEEMAEITPMKYEGPTWQELKRQAQKYRKQAGGES